jgi:hypothetical protein
MKSLIVGMLALAVFAAPCVYDVNSQEPSPFVAVVTAVGLQGKKEGVTAETVAPLFSSGLVGFVLEWSRSAQCGGIGFEKKV